MSPRGGSDAASVQAIAVLNAPAQEWAASILSLTRSGADVVVLASENPERAKTILGAMDVRIEDWPLSRAVEEFSRGDYDFAMIVTSPTILPADPYASCAAVFASDLRIATVSFQGNNADYLSFPTRCHARGMLEPGWDENRLTTRLRELHPEGTWAPIATPAGGAVAVSATAVRTLGAWEDAPLGPPLSVVDFALRAARRGLRNVLDPRTFLNRPVLPFPFAFEPLTDQDSRAWIRERHAGALALYDYQRDADDTPLAELCTVSRCGTLGMDILMECDALGPLEMGTQVSLLATIDALAAHPLVRQLIVGVPHGTIPRYAWRTLTQPGVRVVDCSGYRFAELDQKVDILYRPYQPRDDLPFGRWREIAGRLVASMLDLIAYDIGAYHGAPETWLAFRRSIRDGVACLDGVIAISHDCADSLRREGLPIDPDRITVIEIGTDHLAETTDTQCPAQVAERGLDRRPFMFVLGASYAHKNRDLAIKAWRLLRERGHDIDLVLAGVVTGSGSTRNDEALLLAEGDQPLVLPDVTRAERDWLFAHSQVVLYPTSAEGFGLLPFEAALFGKPTAFVHFGPLAEVLGDVPGQAKDWSPDAFADAVATLLNEPEAAQAQVDAIRARIEELTWKRMAGRLVDSFLATLARPRSATARLVQQKNDLLDEVARLRPETERADRAEAEVGVLKHRLHTLSPIVRVGGFVARTARKMTSKF